MNWLLTISAVDEQLLNRCQPVQQRWFYILSCCMLLLNVLAFLAGWQLGSWAFHRFGIALLFALFFGAMLGNLYRFLLSTIVCRATYDRYLKLPIRPSAADFWRMGLLAMPGLVVSASLLAAWHPATINYNWPENAGIANHFSVLWQQLGSYLFLWMGCGLLLWWTPLLAKQFIKPLRQGEYEWLRNQYENQRIRDQYAYAKDAWISIISRAVNGPMREGFDPDSSFVKDPFAGKLLDANAAVNVPLAMADDTALYAGIEQTKQNLQSVETGVIQDCDFCAASGLPVSLLETGLARCKKCEAEAIDDEDELHKIFAEALLFFESKHVGLPRYIRPRFATPQEIASFNQQQFIPTSGFDSRPVGLAAAPAITNQLDTIFIERGFSKGRVFATIIHELVHVWQFNNLDADKLFGTGKQLQYMEGLARWAELDALESIGEYQLVNEIQQGMEVHEDEYAEGYQLLLNEISMASPLLSPFEIYQQKFGC